MGFNAAAIQVKENDIDAAYASLDEAKKVMDQFQLKFLETQVQQIEVIIKETMGDYVAMADHCMKAIEEINQSVVDGGLQIGVPRIYAQMARAQIKTGNLDAAEKSIEAGFHLDPSEPLLWVEKGRLQQARSMPQMAMASANYALAIWKDADEDYVMLKRALALVAELQSQ